MGRTIGWDFHTRLGPLPWQNLYFRAQFPRLSRVRSGSIVNLGDIPNEPLALPARNRDLSLLKKSERADGRKTLYWRVAL